MLLNPQHPTRTTDPQYALDLQVNDDGSAWLFSGEVASGNKETGEYYVLEGKIAGFTSRFVALMGDLYKRATYLGSVDVAIVVTNTQGVISASFKGIYSLGGNLPSYEEPAYKRVERVEAPMMLENPLGVAQRLVMPWVEFLTQGRYSPFPK